jgi:hypothetical protein
MIIVPTGPLDGRSSSADIAHGALRPRNLQAQEEVPYFSARDAAATEKILSSTAIPSD